MNNAWIVVPVISNDTDLSALVDKLSGGYVAPATYKKMSFNKETSKVEEQDVEHPYAGQTGPDFSNKIIFVNKVDGYTEYSGVVHLEDFADINIYRYWNTAFEHAKSNGADAVFLLNGAIDLDTFALKDAYDDFVEQGKEVVNVADGAIVLLDANTDLRADEQFQIWFGDNDLYRRAESVLGYSRQDFINMSYLINHNHDENFNSIVTSDETKYSSKWS